MGKNNFWSKRVWVRKKYWSEKRLESKKLLCLFFFWMELLTGTTPVNNSLLTGTIPVNNLLLTGTVPVNKSLLTGTWSLSIIPYWQGPYNIVYGVYFTLDLDWLAKINDHLTYLFLNTTGKHQTDLKDIKDISQAYLN